MDEPWFDAPAPLLPGGTVVVMRAFDADAWLETVDREGVTHSAMVPVQFQRILDPEDARARPASVGKPLMGTDLRILDDNDAPCPPGVAGEIVGRGRITMAGYHGREDANRAATWTDAVIVDALPRNPNGKVLKRELRTRYRSWLTRPENRTEAE